MMTTVLEVLIAEAEGRPKGGLMDGNHYGCLAPFWPGSKRARREPEKINMDDLTGKHDCNLFHPSQILDQFVN